MSMLSWAEIYHERGWPLIKLPHREKAPRIPDWPSVTYSREDLAREFGNGACNMGVILGKRAGGLVDLDIDCPEGALAWRHFGLDTGQIGGRTSAPGSHHFYYCDGEPATSKFKMPGPSGEMLLELRADGAQTVIPPSVHPTGELYEWEVDNGPADVTWSQLLRRAQVCASAIAIARHWPEGGRHEVALSLAGWLAKTGRWSQTQTAHFMSGVCALAGDEERADRQRAVEDTYARLAAGDEVRGYRGLAEMVDEAVLRRVGRWLDVGQIVDLPTDGGQMADRPADSRPLLITFEEMAAHLKPPEYVVDGLKEINSFGVVVGQWGVGKTAHQLDEAIRVATGLQTIGGRRCGPGPVAYVLGEGHGGIARRIAAWKKHHGVDPKGIRFVFTTRSVGLMNEPEARLLHDQLARAADEWGAPPSLISLDTLARNSGGGDESSPSDMQRWVDSVDRWLREPFKACVTAIHHPGHNAKDRGRGGSSLPAAADWEYLLYTAGPGVIGMKCQKAKDFEPPPDLFWRMTPVTIEVEGHEVSSITVEALEHYEPVKSATPQQREMLGALTDLLHAAGRRLEVGGRDPEDARITVDDLRAECVARGIVSEDRRRWSQAWTGLTNSGHVIFDPPFVLLRPI